MLVLTRKNNESLDITNTDTGDVIEIMVVEVRGNRVRLGIGADPDKYRVRRSELPKDPSQPGKEADPNPPRR